MVLELDTVQTTPSIKTVFDAIVAENPIPTIVIAVDPVVGP